MAPTAIVLHGTTSAGKSSIAKALQATAPVPAFHISLDAFVTMSNRRDMRSDAERAQAYRFIAKTCARRWHVSLRRRSILFWTLSCGTTAKWMPV